MASETQTAKATFLEMHNQEINRKLQIRESRGGYIHVSGIINSYHLAVTSLTSVLPQSFSLVPRSPPSFPCGTSTTCQDYPLSMSWCSWTSKFMDFKVHGLGCLWTGSSPWPQKFRRARPTPLAHHQQLETCLGHTCPTRQHCRSS